VMADPLGEGRTSRGTGVASKQPGG
jgi:hypothetical protein